jgi:diketogulonate reductase-like aldo/keto reductase
MDIVPRIGLGTWQAGGAGAARAPLEQVLPAFVERGGTFVDSSPMYGRAEEVVGDIAAKLGLRPHLFLATKVWTTGRDAGVRQMEASLRKLRTESLDLMQVHNLVDADVHLDTLAGWKRDGRVRHIGVTHYQAGAHEALALALTVHALDFLQVNYSVAEPEAERRLLPLARDRGVRVVANRPFAEGDLLRHLAGRPLPSYAGEIGCTSWAQLLLKFVVSHPAITCAIPATSKVAHLVDNMAANAGRLPDEALRRRIAADAR